MRFIWTWFAVLLVSIPAIGISTDYQEFGDGLTDIEEIRIGHLLSNPEEYIDKTVKVVGLVNDVCPMRGCWVEGFSSAYTEITLDTSPRFPSSSKATIA